MAIDTANKRRNALNISMPFLSLALLPASGVDTDDRENLTRSYIGFTYAPPVVATGYVHPSLTIGLGIRLGVLLLMAGQGAP